MTTCTHSHPLLAALLTDSYKYGHFAQYPANTTKMVAYGEFRAPFNKDKSDQRIVFYGMRQIIKDFVAIPWSAKDVERLDDFLKTHDVFGAYPFPKELFMKFVNNNNGYFPIKIEALPEGSVIYPHEPVYQITAENEWSPLVTFFETLLTHVWYPSAVATLSRKAKQIIADKFTEANVSEDTRALLLNSRLHDFGYRGATGFEQAKIGGTAHLLNFTGSDTVAAAYYAQYELNKGKPVATSIPATEHSVMLSYGKSHKKLANGGIENEMAAIQNMIDINTSPAAMATKAGKGQPAFTIFACVADTYDYWNTMFKIFPSLNFHGKDFTMVWRPDSGDTTLAVLDGLIAIELFEVTKGLAGNVTGKNYYADKRHTSSFSQIVANGSASGSNAVGSLRKEPKEITFLHFNNFAIIQGDGVDLTAIEEVLTAVMDPSRRVQRIKQLYEGCTGKAAANGSSATSAAAASYPEGHLISKTDMELLLSQSNVAYSPVNVAFGMGGGLLQKVNRDTMSFATKLCYLKVDGQPRTVMKDPKTDPDKRSLAGELAVKLVDDQGYSPFKTDPNSLFVGCPLVVPKNKLAAGLDNNLLRVVYDGNNKQIQVPTSAFTDDFDTIRKRVEDQWSTLKPQYDAVSADMKKLQSDTAAGQNLANSN